MNYLIRISYDGSKFYGFQRLNDKDTIQKRIEDALKKISKKEIEVKGAGRTDRGVHAIDQCVSFSMDVNISLEGLKKALNSLLEPYIYVKEVKEVDDNFHARFAVSKKKYIYKINIGEYNPIISDYVYQSKYELDIDKIKEVGDLYLGVHDFRNFVSGERNNSQAIIYNISYDIKDDILNIIFEGKSFYRYMVRNLVGMMIEVSRGKESIDKVKDMISSTDKISGYTAPANGLYLAKIDY